MNCECILFQGVTTKAVYHACEMDRSPESAREAKKCSGETGFYLDPTQPCRTYSGDLGFLPNLNENNWNIVCTKPSKLTDIFKASSELNDLTFKFMDQNQR